MKKFLDVPKRIHHAIIILSFLAGHKGKYAASLSLISKNLHMSYGYLEEIVAPLKKADLVKAYRGSAGGYRLAKPAHAISILDLIVALEGGLKIVACVGGKCRLEEKCPSKNIHIKMQKELEKSMGKLKISDFK